MQQLKLEEVWAELKFSRVTLWAPPPSGVIKECRFSGLLWISSSVLNRSTEKKEESTHRLMQEKKKLEALTSKLSSP